MTRRRKIATWVALVLSVPATGYAATSVIFYAWLNAAEPGRWPTDRAAVWMCGAFALTIAFVAVFTYCVVTLVKDQNNSSRAERNAT
jgi:hypothetical protein